MAKTRAQQNRAIRQEALREQLSNQGHLQYAVENIQKIEQLEPSDSFNQLLTKYKTAAELRLRMVNKYLPDLKNTEITGEAGGSLTIKVTEYTPKDD